MIKETILISALTLHSIGDCKPAASPPSPPIWRLTYPFYGFFFLRRHLDVIHLGGFVPNGPHLPLQVPQLPQRLIQHLDELLLVLADLL